MKKKIIISVLVIALCLTLFTACYGDKDYLKDVENYGFWDNTAATSIAQPQIGRMVRDFFLRRLKTVNPEKSRLSVTTVVAQTRS